MGKSGCALRIMLAGACMDNLQGIASNLWGLFRFPNVYDTIDIILVTILMYNVINFLRKTKALSALVAVLALIVVMTLSQFLKLFTMNYILESALQVGVIAIIILFQPELRRGLEQLGGSRLGTLLNRESAGNIDYAILQTVEACKSLSQTREGALVVFERVVRLDDIVRTGTLIDAGITSELLKNIFYPKAPLHDGAVIIRQGRIAGAGCVLPLTNNQNLSKDLGMRHRAGMGMSENSDAVVVVVSEETGAISVAIDGMLKRHLSADTLEKLLRQNLAPKAEEDGAKGLAAFLARLRKGKNA